MPCQRLRSLRLLLPLLLLAAGGTARAFTLTLLEAPGLRAQLSAPEARLSREAPLVATLEVETAAQRQPNIPDLRERLRGFTIVEAFPAGRVEAAGRARTRWRLRLTPAGAGPWRLMPFLLTARDASSGKTDAWLTRAVDFPEPLPLPGATGSPECDLAPAWIAPGWRTFGLWSLYLLVPAALLAALWPLLRKLRRTLHERTLSPAQRANLELERLLQQGLPARGLFKRFYAELTGVLRRYYERAYALRATRQTTPEFLATLAADPRFTPTERTALADFLSAADRVKFANISATCAQADAAVDALRAVLRPTSAPEACAK